MPRLQSITIQCLEALQFLHGLGLIHCDLKPENILGKSYSRCEREVIDLGSSTGVWSLGCILAELCTGNVLFQNDSLANLLSRVMGIIGSIDHEMLTKGRDSHKYFKEIDCDEICSSGGKKSAGGNWLSVSQGIAEDASDLVSGFATIGDGLSESVDHRNEYWDSDEYEGDEDIGYVSETWFLAHEIDYPSDHEKGTTRESPDHHGRDATKDEDEDDHATALDDEEQVRQIKAQEEEFETFDLKIVHRKNRTGFEEEKNFHVVLNSVIAGRYHVTDLQTGMDVCIKMIKNNKYFFDQSLDEIKLLKYVNKHDPAGKYHLVRLYDYFYYREHLLIVCELLKANLYEFHKFNRESGGEVYFTMPRLQSITIQCLEALQFLHGLGLNHCDLKPENIPVKSYSRCERKFIDLGSSFFETDHLRSYVQSRSYRAPEVILGLPYDKKIDVWSLGCILAELCTGKVLFQNDSLASLLSRVMGIIGSIDHEMLTKGRDSHKYFKEIDCEEICSSGGKKSAGGNWLSVSQGIAEDASDLVSGFATIGDGLSESVDYRNEYWDSDEYEDDDDIGYVRQPIEDETWFLAHEIDYPSDHEKGTTRESPDHHGRDATKDEDDQSYAAEASYLSGEQCLQSKDAEPISSENNRRLTVSEIYPASKKNDLISPYDGQLMDVWQGFVAQTNELLMLGDKKGLNAHRKSHLDDVCLEDDQHDSVRSIGVGINSDAADFGSEVRESLAGGSSEGDFEYSRDHDGVASRFKQLYSESDKKHVDGSNKNNNQKASKNDGPGGSFHVKIQTDGCKFMNAEDISGSCLVDIDKIRLNTGEDIILFGNKALWSEINTSKGKYMGSTRLRTEDVVDTTSENWKECSVKTLFRSYSRGYASTSCNLITSILLSFCKGVSAETIREPACGTCYVQLIFCFVFIVVIGGILLSIWKCRNQVAEKKKKKKPKKDKTKKNDNGEVKVKERFGDNDNGKVKEGFGDVFVKFFDKHNLPAKDNVDVQEEVLPEASDEEEVLSEASDEARLYEARVYAGVYNQRDVALKVYPTTDLHFELMVNELAKTYKTDYQANIIHCYGIQRCKGRDSFCLLLQPWECTLGELVEFFWGSKQKKKTLSEKHEEFFKGYRKKDFWEPSNHPTPLFTSLLKGIIKGVGQLHSHEIVHRDLHPGNILITSDGKTLTARIGGLSRSMYVSEREGLTDSDGKELRTLKIDGANNMWQPPDVVSGTKKIISCENDMYSVGCIFIYAIAQTVLPDKKQDAFDLVEFVPEAYHLVKGLMHNSLKERPTAGKARHHPFFWDKDKRMRFFEVASNRLDSATRNSLQGAVAHSLSSTLKGRSNIRDWQDCLEKDLVTHMRQYANYNQGSFFYLVRAVRNSSQHFANLPPALNINSQTEVWEHFAKKFPALLIEVYKVVETLVKRNNHDKAVTFKTFFKE